MKFTKETLLDKYNGASILVHGLVNRSTGDRLTTPAKLPAKCGWALGRIERDQKPKVARYEEDRLDLYKRLGVQVMKTVKDADGKETQEPTDFYTPPAVGTPEFDVFTDALKALNAEEVECPFTLRIEDFGDALIEPELIAALGELVVFEDEAK